MKKLVLDTSIIIKWFTQEKGFEKTNYIFDELKTGKIKIYLPELVKYEFGNALLKGKKLVHHKAKFVLKTFYKLPFIFATDDLRLTHLSYQIAQKLNITYYDACFLALAKLKKATVITANPKHQKKKKIKGIKIKALY